MGDWDIIYNSMVDAVSSTSSAVILTLGVLVFTLIIFAIYVYSSLAWMTIAQKLKYKKSWLAWIPLANMSMMLQLGGFNWAWVFLILIPIVGWIALGVLIIIATWRIFEIRNYPGWFSLSIILPKVGGILYLVAIGFVAWANKTKTQVVKKSKKKVVKKKKVSKKRR